MEKFVPLLDEDLLIEERGGEPSTGVGGVLEVMPGILGAEKEEVEPVIGDGGEAF